MDINGMQEKIRMDILGMGEIDIIVGYDWLERYNLMIDFITKEVTKRHLARRIAEVRLLGTLVEQTKGLLRRVSNPRYRQAS